MKITRYELKTKNRKDYTAILLADLHSKVPQGLLDAVKAEKPDLILMPGDVIDNGVKNAPEMLPFLSSLCEIAPTFYAGGNHELFHEKDFQAVRNTGVTYLEDQTAYFEELTIGGIASGYGFKKQGHFVKTPPPNLDYLADFAKEDGFKILLSHHPEYYAPYLKDLPIDLTVSGHAHGGQWRIFGRGVFAPGQGIFPRYTAGVHDNRFIISRGLGSHTVIPRIFNTPEMIVITLNKA